eukprot:1145210-Pelagomonas_calceolata.AAC.2
MGHAAFCNLREGNRKRLRRGKRRTLKGKTDMGSKLMSTGLAGLDAARGLARCMRCPTKMGDSVRAPSFDIGLGEPAYLCAKPQHLHCLSGAT